MKASEKNSLIVIQGGIGDVLLWTPALKAFDHKPDVLFLYHTPVIDLLKENALVRNVFKVQTKWGLFAFALKHAGQYDYCFLNHLCGGNFLLKAMKMVSRIVQTNSVHFQPEDKVMKKDVLYGVHDALQNYHLAHDRKPQLSSSNFELKTNCGSNTVLPHRFTALQISAGDNKAQYKNWPIQHWRRFIELFLQHYPQQNLVILGHPNEAGLVKELPAHKNIISLVGKTSIAEASCVLKQSDFFIGLDGGLMHMAVAVAKPTFTIWGGSSPQLYGYAQFGVDNHRVVQSELRCGPCNAWHKPNITKTNDPSRCADFECLVSLSPASVFEQLQAFISSSLKIS